MEPNKFQAVYGKVKDAALAKAIVPTVADGNAASQSVLELAPPKQMNVILLTLAYTLLGLSEAEIAYRLGTNASVISRVQSHEAYNRAKAAWGDALNSTEFDEVQVAFRKHAPEAARVMIELTQDKPGRSEYIRSAAAKDVLDRAGYTPKPVVEHKHSVDGGLRIEYVDKTDKLEDIPTVIENGE